MKGGPNKSTRTGEGVIEKKVKWRAPRLNVSPEKIIRGARFHTPPIERNTLRSILRKGYALRRKRLLSPTEQPP
jgi:hypothetical protein